MKLLQSAKKYNAINCMDKPAVNTGCSDKIYLQQILIVFGKIIENYMKINWKSVNQ